MRASDKDGAVGLSEPNPSHLEPVLRLGVQLELQ